MWPPVATGARLGGTISFRPNHPGSEIIRPVVRRRWLAIRTTTAERDGPRTRTKWRGELGLLRTACGAVHRRGDGRLLSRARPGSGAFRAADRRRAQTRLRARARRGWHRQDDAGPGPR